jgi:hypothetical protein
MVIPETVPSDESFLGYILFCDNEVLIQAASVPFWFRTLMGSLNLIGPETDALLERIIVGVLECPTVEHLIAIRKDIKTAIVSARGRIFDIGFSPIERKYHVIISLLQGLELDPFNDYDWAATLMTYTMDAFRLDDSGKAELERRIRAALADYEPPAA